MNLFTKVRVKLKIYSSSGRFPACWELFKLSGNFQFIWKIVKLSGRFLAYEEDFWLLWNISILVENFPDYLEACQIVWKHFRFFGKLSVYL